MGIRGWAALAVGAAVLAALLPLWRSSFVRERRAAFAFHRAEGDIAARQLDKAVAGLRTALRLQPGNARARTRLAETELARGQWEIAFLEYQELTDLHPEDPEGWIGLGGLMLKTGLLATSEAALDKAIARAPERAGSRLLRAQIRYRVGRFHGAQLDARAAAQSTPPDPSAELLARCIDAKRAEAAPPDGCERAFGVVPVPAGRVRAETQAGGGKLASLAREHWPGRMAQMRQALEIQLRKQDWSAAGRIVASARRAYPDGPFAPFLAGIVEIGRGRPEDAEPHFHAALAAAPRSAVVAAALAKSWSRRGGAMIAGDRLMEIAGKDPGFAFARDIAARAYMDARDPGKAEAALRRGLVLEPDSAVPYEQLADFYIELDRPADALGIAQQGAERFPDDAAVQLSMGRILADSGKPEDAIRVYRGLLSRRPDLDVAAYRIAALADKDEPAARAALLRDLGTDHPSDPVFLDALGWLEAQAGDPKRARRLLEAARDAAPDEPASHYHLAVLYERQKRTDLAREELKAAVESGRPFAERLEALRLLRQGENPARVRP